MSTPSLADVTVSLRQLGASALLSGALDDAAAILGALRELERIPQSRKAAPAVDTGETDAHVPVESPAVDTPEDSPLQVEPETSSEDESAPGPEPMPSVAACNETPPEVPEPHAGPAMEAPEPAAPAPRVPVRRQRSTIRKSLERFFSASKELCDASWQDRPQLAVELRAAICWGRAATDAAEVDPGQLETVKEELDRLGGVLRRLPEGSDFFGLSLRRHLSVQAWEELAEAYEQLVPALACEAWLQEGCCHDNATFDRLLSLASAAEALLHRRLLQYAPGVHEQIQMDLHMKFAKMAKGRDVYIDWWKGEEVGGPSVKAIAAEAMHLSSVLSDAMKRRKNAKDTERLFEEFRCLLAGPATDTFVEVFPAKVMECLEAGVAPSNKPLRELALPYRALLEEAGSDAHLQRLIKYLKQDETKQVAGGRVPTDADLPEDENIAGLRNDLLPLLQGKTVLFVGGNPKPQKLKQVRDALGLGELIWPQSDEATHSEIFRREVDKADLVCLLVRWARHARADVIGQAKAAGKLTAILPRGLGVNRIVTDLHQQLVKPEKPVAMGA